MQRCGSSLYDGHNGYRLGDMLYSRYFRHSGGGRFFHLQQFPRSIASRYLTSYLDKRPEFSPAMAVAEIISMLPTRETGKQQHKVLGVSRWKMQPTVAAVHLRVGDVVELAKLTTVDLLCIGGGAWVEWKSTKDTNGTRRVVPRVIGSKPYVKPMAYYMFLASALRERRVERVVLVGASSYNMSALAPGYPRSCDYMRRVGSVFSSAGFDVSFRLGGSPDEDIAFFASVGVFVPSGGQYSALASDVAALYNVTILRPVSEFPEGWARAKPQASQRLAPTSRPAEIKLVSVVGAASAASSISVPGQGRTLAAHSGFASTPIAAAGGHLNDTHGRGWCVQRLDQCAGNASRLSSAHPAERCAYSCETCIKPSAYRLQPHRFRAWVPNYRSLRAGPSASQALQVAEAEAAKVADRFRAVLGGYLDGIPQRT